ncbi:MAG TPA: hypothetical protein VF656_01320 [Pyrinomonadaceae bacterium]|jgi:hypothetical protein
MGGVNLKPNVPGAGENPPGKVQGGQSTHGHADTPDSHAPQQNGQLHGLARAEERIGARVGELAAQSQQIADKIKRGGNNPQHTTDSASNGKDARSGRVQGQSNGHGGDNGRVQTGRGSEARSHESHGNDSHIQESHGHDSHAGESHGRESRSSLTSNAVNYLRGVADRDALPPDVRRALDTLKTAVGGNDLDALLNERGHKVEKVLDHFLRRAEHAYEKFGEQFGEQLGEQFGEHLNGHGDERPGRALGRVFQQVADELVDALQLEKHFARLERLGGDPARRAEEAVLRLLFAPAQEGEGGGSHGRDLRLTELWRDLRSGAFLPAHEAHSPFPLTGRARVASEMIELMHTLDAIERAEAQLFPNGRAGSSAQQTALAETLAGRLAHLTDAELAELLNLLPTLPGRAGRNEMVRLLAALAGPLVDANGRMILAKDGTPLKLDQLLWLSTAGGLLGANFKSDLFPVHLSSLIVFGFDALYSLIGFDGRTLAAPHFAAVQAQINGSELEWVCGQPPLTEGWMRALIERLKDAAVADQNLLGEMLEEALVDGRFHAVLVRGSVEEGEAVTGSFTVTRLLPDPGDAPDFAPGFAPA